jgi:flavin reductase (DIM6/NTAB) family NADH-FMN oxidoreductase RutF
MKTDDTDRVIVLPTDRPVWDRFFQVAPLVIVGSKEGPDRYDLAPKHMAMPLGWDNFYTFVCSPRHATYHNIQRYREFTVSSPRPGQVLHGSLAAAPRCDDQTKPSLQAVPTFPAREVDGVLVRGGAWFLECRLHSILDGFGANSLIIGTVVAAAADEDALRREDLDENDQIYHDPLLAYLSPGRMAEVRESTAFPFPKGIRY